MPAGLLNVADEAEPSVLPAPKDPEYIVQYPETKLNL